MTFEFTQTRAKWMYDQPGEKRRVAYCNYKKHKGWLSVKSMKKHKCLCKQCPFLIKIDAHPYWDDRARKKRLAKENKKRYTQ